jgi:hypothetical protein
MFIWGICFVQVLNQWAIVRDLLFTYSRGPARHRSQESAWQYVLQQRPNAEVVNILSLYVLSQIIATQSADVERGFSLLNSCLGLNRLRTKTITLDCRLRVKQALPGPFKSSAEACEMSLALETIGVEAADATGVCAHEIHGQLLLPNTPKLMLLTLHDRLGIEKSNTWEDIAEQFDMIDNVSVHEPGMLEMKSVSRMWNLRIWSACLPRKRV